ncbi:hypothetical protein CJ672_03400 [Arcobacter cryaerophilus gv. occultus]|jgi:hypothetical protein|uniref:hypothetical protein n=1 Tax=Aliarcobacter cryaerophilus TaxID=28198 RepID=UPI000D01AB73|nr:hypothetical protein [Aliarcobacter cryaerophilus]MBP7250991.1 hypothetical protein [Aliarcobacter sp.]PRM93334.1 hypothetical protein CJ672_03400 [Arcobacter cryaerophilus gv. occultus]
MVDNSLQNNNYGLGLYSNSNLQNSTQNVGKTSSGEKELEQAKDNKVKDNEAVSLSKNVEKAVDTKSISKSNEFENFQNKINSFTADNKTIKDIQEDMKLLSSADGDVDTKKVNDRINQNIDKLENLSKDEKTKLKDNLNGVDNIVNNNIKGIQDAAKEMQDFIKNRSSRGEENNNSINVNYSKDSMSFTKNNVLNLQGSFANIQANLNQDMISKLLR